MLNTFSMDNRSNGKDDSGGYLIRWRGRQEGPFELGVIRAKLNAKQIGLLHEISRDGQWITLREFLAELEQAREQESRARLAQEKRQEEQRVREEEEQRAAQEHQLREAKEEREKESREERRMEAREDRRLEARENRQWREPAAQFVPQVSTSTIVCSYLVCIFCSVVGLGMGIYLVAKNETGHGIACIILSVFGYAIGYAIGMAL